MPTTPSKLNISFGRNSYSVFGSRGTGGNTEQQQEQKTELLEGKGCVFFCMNWGRGRILSIKSMTG